MDHPQKNHACCRLSSLPTLNRDIKQLHQCNNVFMEPHSNVASTCGHSGHGHVSSPTAIPRSCAGSGSAHPGQGRTSQRLGRCVHSSPQAPFGGFGVKQCKRPPAAEFPASLPPHRLIPWHHHPPVWVLSPSGPRASPSLGPSLPPRGAGASCAPTPHLGAKKRSMCEWQQGHWDAVKSLILPDSARSAPRTHLPAPSVSGILQLPPPKGTRSTSQICCKGLNCAVKISRVRKAGGGKRPSRGAEQLI